jgi:hypothetical protein
VAIAVELLRDCCVLTLVFQIWVRSGYCVAAIPCSVSFLKAIVWASIWPVSWIVYLIGMTSS